MAEVDANTNSLLISFSALNVHHQNTELNPNAPEYIPTILHHHHQQHATTSPFFFHYDHYCPPPPTDHPFVPYTLIPTQQQSHPQTGFCYFQPLIPQHPQTVFSQFIPQLQVQPQLQLTWSQPIVDHMHVDVESRRGRSTNTAGNNIYRSMRLGGRCRKRGAPCGVWRVKGGGSSAEPNSGVPVEREKNRVNKANRMTLTSVANESQERDEEEDSSMWRMVKYKACKKFGKKFEIQQVNKSVKKTTVMIRNIPSRYTRDMMLTFLDRHCMEVNQKLKQSCTLEGGCCLSAYDFFYMPMDFKTGLNKSYAFVNFTTPEAVWRFHTKCDAQKWELFESIKIRHIALAKLQGTKELIEHFGRTAFACDCDEFLPVYFQPPRAGRGDVDIVTSIIGKRVS